MPRVLHFWLLNYLEEVFYLKDLKETTKALYKQHIYRTKRKMQYHQTIHQLVHHSFPQSLDIHRLVHHTRQLVHRKFQMYTSA